MRASAGAPLASAFRASWIAWEASPCPRSALRHREQPLAAGLARSCERAARAPSGLRSARPSRPSSAARGHGRVGVGHGHEGVGAPGAASTPGGPAGGRRGWRSRTPDRPGSPSASGRAPSRCRPRWPRRGRPSTPRRAPRRSGGSGGASSSNSRAAIAASPVRSSTIAARKRAAGAKRLRRVAQRRPAGNRCGPAGRRWSSEARSPSRKSADEAAVVSLGYRAGSPPAPRGPSPPARRAPASGPGGTRRRRPSTRATGPA